MTIARYYIGSGGYYGQDFMFDLEIPDFKSAAFTLKFIQLSLHTCLYVLE